MVEFADLFEGLLELVVVPHPAAHFPDLFAAQAELAGAAASISDGQNRQRVPAAAGANRAAAAVAHGPLDQRNAQQLTRHGEAGHHRLARCYELVSRPSNK